MNENKLFEMISLDRLKTMYTDIKRKINKKVDKVTGKGLSEVDVTSEMKQGWDEAQPNVIESISVQKSTDESDTVLQVQENGKKVIIPIPGKFSELTNDLTGDNELLTRKFYVDVLLPAIAASQAGNINQVVCKDGVLPEHPLSNTIYYVPAKKTIDGEEHNYYTEYMLVTIVEGEGDDAVTTQRLEKFGDTRMDLSGYVKLESIYEVTNQDILDMIEEVDAGETTPTT